MGETNTETRGEEEREKRESEVGKGDAESSSREMGDLDSRYNL